MNKIISCSEQHLIELTVKHSIKQSNALASKPYKNVESLARTPKSLITKLLEDLVYSAKWFII